MHEAKNYGALRETHQATEAERAAAQTGAELSVRQTVEKPPELAIDQQEPAPERSFMTELDKIDAAREAKITELSEKVLSGKIDRHEMHYQLTRFENEQSPPAEQDVTADAPRPLKFFEDQDRSGEKTDKEQERDGAEQSPSKEQGGHRTLNFFEDRNNTQEHDR